MPRRRPPREGNGVNNLILFAAAILFLPWLVDAQQQQRPAVQQRHESPHEGRTLEVTEIPPLQTGLTHNRRKNTLSVSSDNKNNRNDASAPATTALALAHTAVGAPRQSGIHSAGLAHFAKRSLDDWEVEDFVLLATVDGRLHARDRVTGKEKWSFPFGSPMVETKYYRRNRSSVEEDYDPMSIDDYLWIVEPSRDGSLYIYRPSGPNPGLVNTGLTMKKLVEDMPYASEDPPVIYTGEKKTQMITIDAHTGKVLNYYGVQGAIVNEQCQVPSNPGDYDECPRQATLTIGRIEYTVAIQGRKDGRQIATLTFSEWSPNNYDQDLQRQHSKSLDDQFILPGHDGNFFGVDLSKQLHEDRKPKFIHKLASPVVRVFDVAKPWGDKSDPELVILPQPAPPIIEDEVTISRRAASIFLNHTEDGSWFAMSGQAYPWAVQTGSRQAQINQQGWMDHRSQWDIMDNVQLSQALVGLHSIDGARSESQKTISAPLDNNQSEEKFAANTPSLLEDPTWFQRMLALPRSFADSLLEFIKNPFWIIILVIVIISNQREIRSWVGRHAGGKGVGRMFEQRETRTAQNVDRLPEIPEDEEIKLPVPEQPPTVIIEDTPGTEKLADGWETVDKETTPPTLEAPNESKSAASASPEKEKKKAHRGRRGGVKHKKGRATSQGASEDGTLTPTPKPLPTVEDAVRDAQNMGQPSKMEPDIVTVPTDPTEVSGPILRIGALEVNQEACIGIGSNGTMVFKGIFDGREVAVKRMMIQFFDIASQETKLLRESDDHPNGESTQGPMILC
jgi:serine/threonine-protein kinase/endoribonuclease IRE1